MNISIIIVIIVIVIIIYLFYSCSNQNATQAGGVYEHGYIYGYELQAYLDEIIHCETNLISFRQKVKAKDLLKYIHDHYQYIFDDGDITFKKVYKQDDTFREKYDAVQKAINKMYYNIHS